MEHLTPPTPDPAAPRGPRAWPEAAALAGLLLLICWFYAWTAAPEAGPRVLSPHEPDYYNALARGFLGGHLWLDTPADPFLATLSNPWDPSQRAGHGLHDASYFRGHYYIYFGVTPVVVLFAPVKLLTGLEMNMTYASVVFAGAGLAAATGLLAAVRRRHFPRLPFWTLALGAAALGLANTMPILLRRASVWEVPIAAAYACLMIALCCLHRALLARRPAPWLALASAALGLAVGARPTYLFACCALLVPILVLARRAGGLGPALRNTSWRTAVLAAVLPAAAIGAGLALYNFERFGSPVEFGQLYQMGGDDITKIKLFGWRFAAYGFRLYWLAPATWSPYFPFVSVADIPPRPAGQLGVEDPYGLLPNVPFVVLGLGILVLGRRPRGPGWDSLAGLCACTGVATAATALFVLMFGGVTNRYLVDFAPGCVLLAAIGLMVLVSQCRPGGTGRALVGAAALALAAFSAAFNVLASIRHNELLRADHPELYQRMVGSWNRVPYALDRLVHRGYGPLELTVVFANAAPGTNEPLVVTGHAYSSDYLFVHYEPDNEVTFGLAHTNRPVLLGNPLKLAAGPPHHVEVQMGSLYPPVGHPYFDALGPIEAWMLQSRIKVTVDGQVALEGYTSFYDASAWEPLIGRSEPGGAFPGRFSGRIEACSRSVVATVGTAQATRQGGPLVLTLKLPPFAGVLSEPLICSGRQGRGDLVYVRYLARGQIALGYDHWGYGGPTSAPVEVDPGAIQRISIDYGAIDPSPPGLAEPAAGTPGHVTITVNGRTAIDADQPYYRCGPDRVSFGRNPISSSTAGPEFEGTILELTFLGR